MQNKIVFFDIDGTLLDHQKRVPEGTKIAIKTLQELNIPIFIATGRAPFMFQTLRESFGINGYVGFNGQYVSYNNTSIYENPLEAKKLQELVTQSNEYDHPMVFLNTSEGRSTHIQHPHVQKSMEDLKMLHPPHDPIFYQDRPIFQALLYCEKGNNESYYKKSYQDFHFIRWHHYALDVLPKKGSKAIGIQKMIEHLGYHREDVIAFGDGLNDLEMLEFAGTGIAMGNGKEAAKKSADFVTRDVNDDGIRFGLRKLGLIE